VRERERERERQREANRQTDREKEIATCSELVTSKIEYLVVVFDDFIIK